MKTKKQKMKDLQVKRKHKLMIQKKTVVTDEWENQNEEWSDWKTVTAQRKELFSSDYYAASQSSEKKTVEWKIKYVASWAEEINTNKYRIINIRTDEIWDIKDTDYLNDDGQWLLIEAEKSGELDV